MDISSTSCSAIVSSHPLEGLQKNSGLAHRVTQVVKRVLNLLWEGFKVVFSRYLTDRTVQSWDRFFAPPVGQVDRLARLGQESREPETGALRDGSTAVGAPSALPPPGIPITPASATASAASCSLVVDSSQRFPIDGVILTPYYQKSDCIEIEGKKWLLTTLKNVIETLFLSDSLLRLELTPLKDAFTVPDGSSCHLQIQGLLDGFSDHIRAQITCLLPVGGDIPFTVIRQDGGCAAAVMQSAAIIANPRHNCFINAALISLLTDRLMYDYLIGALDTIAAPSPQSSAKVYNLSTKASAEAIFRDLTKAEAAQSALTILKDWKCQKPLSPQESQMLRLCFPKLIEEANKQTDPFRPIVQLPFSVFWSDEGASDEFIAYLFEALDILSPEIRNPLSKDLIFQTRSKQLGLKEGSLELDLTTLQDRIVPDDPILHFVGIAGIPGINYFSLAEALPTYKLDSFVVYHTVNNRGGHYYTYQKAGDYWLRYDDYKEPGVIGVDEKDEIGKVLSGQVQSLRPSSLLFSKIVNLQTRE
jgi:hypothetical protein